MTKKPDEFTENRKAGRSHLIVIFYILGQFPTFLVTSFRQKIARRNNLHLSEQHRHQSSTGAKVPSGVPVFFNFNFSAVHALPECVARCADAC